MGETNYKFPDNNLLIKSDKTNKMDYDDEKNRIEEFFQNYKIDIDCKEVYSGINSITYVIDLKCKNKVSTIKSYKEDLMLSFNVTDVEFQVAINGSSYLGIHLIKNKNKALLLGDLIQGKEFSQTNKKVPIIIGKDFNDNTIIEDLSQLPHLLVAGTTGTGKSNLLSSFIIDIIYKVKPEEVKLVLIDTRATNFSRFNGTPHLLIPVITNSKRSIGVLEYLIQEMLNRYQLFQNEKVDNIDTYNEVAEQKLPRIVVIIEDFCDLMIETEKEVEQYLQRLIQMSRAAGINLIISTQRPSRDVITGVIKANIPSRIAFKVPSQIDSKTIIDVAGAEELLIYGDILFRKIGEQKIKRIQTPYISDKEIADIINQVSRENDLYFNADVLEAIDEYNNEEIDKSYNIENEEDDTDIFLLDAIEYAIQTGQVSTSSIQRRLKVGYARAGKIIDQMEERGIISGYEGSKPREVLITIEEWNRLKNDL